MLSEGFPNTPTNMKPLNVFKFSNDVFVLKMYFEEI